MNKCLNISHFITQTVLTFATAVIILNTTLAVTVPKTICYAQLDLIVILNHLAEISYVALLVMQVVHIYNFNMKPLN